MTYSSDDNGVCAICFKREKCMKRFNRKEDFLFDINCPDFSRDICFKENDDDIPDCRPTYLKGKTNAR